jgi:hypothetical protein
MRRTSNLGFRIGLACLLSGCVGNIDDRPGGSSGDDDPGSPAPSTPTGQGPRPNPADPGAPGAIPLPGVTTPATAPGSGASCASTPLGAPAMRRLTKGEIANTLRDLLGVEVGVAALPNDVEVSGYDDNRGGILKTTEVADFAEWQAGAAKLLALPALTRAGCSNESTCAVAFVDYWAPRLFRRPLTAEERKVLIGFVASASQSWPGRRSTEMLLEVLLGAPQFLYVSELGASAGQGRRALTDHELATRLALAVWYAGPDDELMATAAQGKLRDPGTLSAQVTRMLADPRALRSLGQFHREWLHVDGLAHEQKEAAFAKQWTPTLIQAADREVEAFVGHVLAHGLGFQGLMTSETLFVDDALAPIYGAPIGMGSKLRTVTAPDRPGILTRVGVLATHVGLHRVVFRGERVRSGVLCQSVPEVPDDVDLTLGRLETPYCAACHSNMDPIGQGFEAFDALGRRIDDAPRAGELMPNGLDESDSAVGRFSSVRELMHKLSRSRAAQSCYVDNLARFVFRSGGPALACARDQALRAMEASGGRIEAAVASLVTSELFVTLSRE